MLVDRFEHDLNSQPQCVNSSPDHAGGLILIFVFIYNQQDNGLISGHVIVLNELGSALGRVVALFCLGLV